MKKIVVAPDSFKGSLTSAEVADAVERGIKDVFPQCNVVKAGVADGGEGTVEAIVKAVGGDMYADPDYVPRARATQALEEARRSGAMPPELQSVQKALSIPDMSRVQIGSVLFANKPGDGSAREQAASCQRVLGGCANLCYEFATKRYRSNCVNWGMLPFTLAEGANFPGRSGDFLYVPQVREKVTRGDEEFPALLLTDSGIHALTLYLKNTTAEERELLLTGCLMNHYAAQNAAENRR